MVYADDINTMLTRINSLGKAKPEGYVVEITLRLLEQSGLTYDEGYAALSVLSGRASYKCIEMRYFPELGIADDGFETVDVMAHVILLPNFNDIYRAFSLYHQYRRRTPRLPEHFPEIDFEGFEKRFATNEPDINWNKKELPSEDDWLKDIRLSVASYNKSTGSLELAPGKAVSIPKKGRVKKSTGEKYFECKVMEKLFNSKTTLSNGVDFHALLGIHKDVTLKDGDVKKVTNVRTAINKKLADEFGLNKLIVLNRNRAYVNHSYLLKN